MKISSAFASVAAVVACSCAAWISAADDDPVAPFHEVHWEEETPHVRVGDVWYELRAIHDLPVRDIVESAKGEYDEDEWRRRFEEDLLEVLDLRGFVPGRTVDLVVRRLDVPWEGTLDAVPLTEAKRREVRESRRVPRVEREHSGKSPETFRYLAKRIDYDSRWASLPLTRWQAEQDLDELERFLETDYSYLTLRAVDYRSAFDAVRANLGNVTTRGSLAIQLCKLLSLFGDGHTRAEPASLPEGYLPFLVAHAEEGPIAFREDRTGFVDEEHPILLEIDGLPLARWVDVAAQLGPGGSGQFTRMTALRNLRLLEYLRRELGLPSRDSVDVLLGSFDGASVRRLELQIAERRPIYGEWPSSETRKMGSGFGYLRIARMDDDPAFLDQLERDLAAFADVPGIVIDVRGNGGGYRDAIRRLLPHLMAANDPPRVVNVAARRLREGETADAPEGYLQNRYLFPLASREWNDRERASIEAFARGFRPSWSHPPGAFSDWAYFAVSPGDESQMRYTGSVVVLMNSDCFSATDVFLGAIEGLPNVTLLGTPSGGGSGRAEVRRLHHSDIEVQCSSMASFRPDGSLYDGVGIVPDLIVEATANDLIGRSDSQLDAAIRLLREKE